jgi:hypothetical protein
MFCRGEWKDLAPEDKDLKAYHAWLHETNGLGLGLERELAPPTVPPAVPYAPPAGAAAVDNGGAVDTRV